MEKAKRKKYHAVIACILIVMVILTGCSKISQQPTDSQPIVESASETESILVSDAPPTTEAPEEAQPTLAAPNAKPENILSLEQPDARMTYLRSLMMKGLSIPKQLGDSCYIKLDIGIVDEPYLHKEVVDGGMRYDYEAFGSAHYIKDNIYYKQTTAYITWRELVDSEQELQFFYNAHFGWAQYNFSEGKLLSQEELNELYTMNMSSDLPTISGTLSQELYPLGQEAGIETPSWGDRMLEAGLWYTKLTGQCYGSICGDIYVMEPNEMHSAGSYWICFDGMEPIKIPRIEATTYQLMEAPPAVEGADFAKEKESALYRLSFDLLVEPAEDAE